MIEIKKINVSNIISNIYFKYANEYLYTHIRDEVDRTRGNDFPRESRFR